jgi:putative ABC transport system permease protein
MLKAALKGLLARKLRLVLSGIAVVLGVLATTAAIITTTTIGSGFDSLFATINSAVDVSVSGKPNVGPANAGKGFTPPVPESLVSSLKSVPGVASAVGEVSVDGARPIGPDGKVISVQGPPRAGVAWRGEVGMIRLRSGRGPSAPNEVAINGRLAELGGFRLGGSIDVLTLAPRQTFTVVGIYGFSNGRDTLGGDTQVAFTDPVAQRLMLGATGVYSSITLTAAPGVSRAELRDRVAAGLGPDYLVRTGDELATAAAANTKQFLDIVRLILLGFAGLSLLVGIFLILNTFSILVAQRTSELALLAALGARRRQIIGSVLIEASLVGTVFSAIGIGLGIGVAALLKLNMEARSGSSLPVGLQVTPSAVLIGLAVGKVVTLLAALLPAIRASRVPPVAAMRAAAAEQRSLSRISLAGFLLGGIGSAGVLAGALDSLGGNRWLAVGFGLVLGLLGIALLTPLASRALLPLVGRVLSWSVPGRLGRRNAARNPRRTAITVATLMITLSLVGGVSVVAASLRANVTTLVTRDLGADLVIAGDAATTQAGGAGRAGPPGGRVTPTFRAAVISQAASIPGVATAVDQYVDTVHLGGAPGVSPMDSPAAAADLPRLASVLGLRSSTGQLPALRADEVAIDEETLRSQGLRVGDPVRIATQRGGWRDYRIVAAYQSSYLVRGPILAPSAAAELFVSAAPAIGYLDLAPGSDAAAIKRAVASLIADNPEVSVRDQTQLARDAATQVDTVEVMLYVLLGLSVIIGILGIINTMALSILERTRELGLLRAIGLRRWQMVRMVSTESVLISVFGGLLGLTAGVAAGIGVVGAAQIQPLAISPTSLLIFLALAVVAGLLAALAPSSRAAKVNVLSAIAYE